MRAFRRSQPVFHSAGALLDPALFVPSEQRAAGFWPLTTGALRATYITPRQSPSRQRVQSKARGLAGEELTSHPIEHHSDGCDNEGNGDVEIFLIKHLRQKAAGKHERWRPNHGR